MANPERFRIIRRLLAPRWLTDDEGGQIGLSLDLLKDATLERLRLGLLARFPTTAPPDALAAIGRDRRVVRGFSEGDESYARRLIAWLDDRKTAGNPFALMQKLAEYTGSGPSFRTVDARGNWYSRAADGSRTFVLNQGNWDWDGDISGERWSRFWVIMYPNGTWGDEGTWGDGALWGDGGTWGSTLTSDQIATIRFIVRDWKPLHAKCVNIIVALDPASFDPASPEPDGDWQHMSESASPRPKSRLATARYLDGV